ncbi:VpsF family polysaccharide biosynthesis protein [Celeribacter halophilus]|uniref:O-antigen ligase like membrane protein n=1 Tax=Celeribacter halophilus TaxID=576117 RepID=A0A1I3WGL4_9RHOB|nr:VpsF family polysaccharide biosynthesis protein [Celeribacter halophilus]PZX09858.1 hypothetical protein LX82_02672 [Celeribacter halophilus]SFK06645.1 hypothetical protein SAMN04488138_1258 [Celeribacter halophilus]
MNESSCSVGDYFRQSWGGSGALFLIGLFLRLALSNGLLNQFIPYTLPGGSIVFKIHIGTVLILTAFLLRSKKIYFPQQFRAVGRSSYAFMLILVYATIWLVLQFGISSVAYLVDTFFCALFGALYLLNARRVVAWSAFKMIVVFTGINSVVAIFEFITRAHFLPDPGFRFYYFRSYALFGHPLLNALLTGVVGIFVLRDRSLGRWSLLYFLLATIAILSFGGRAALVMFVLVAVTSELIDFSCRFFAGRATWKHLITMQIATPVLISSGLFLLLETPLGERFMAMKGLDDNSTGARLHLLSIYDGLSKSDVLLGISASTKRLLIDQNSNFNTIENFWVDMALSFGLIAFSFIALGMLVFMYQVARSGSTGSIAAGIFFLLVASTNNALSIKSPALFVLVSLLLAAQRARTHPQR